MDPPKSLQLTELPIESRILFVPPLEDIAEAFKNELPKNFSVVSVDVVDCPDLSKEPFGLASKGLGGCTSLLDVGGPAYLLPLVQRNKVYDLKGIPSVTGANPAFAIGAAGGPWPYAKTNCELVVNVEISNGIVNNGIRIAKVSSTKNNGPDLEIPPQTETRFCLLANLFCCNGEPSKVVEIKCKTRTGDKDFITALRTAVSSKFQDVPVGMGGVFLLANGKAKHHVMPDYSTTPINSDEELNRWLKFYDLKAPIVEVGTFISKDPGLDLRPQHFHGYSDTEGGHYHYDTTPNEVEYVAYMSPASMLYRIDKPKSELGIGKD